MLQPTNRQTLEEQARGILGEEAFTAAQHMDIAGLHRAFSAEYQRIHDAKADAYRKLIVARSLRPSSQSQCETN